AAAASVRARAASNAGCFARISSAKSFRSAGVSCKMFVSDRTDACPAGCACAKTFALIEIIIKLLILFITGIQWVNEHRMPLQNGCNGHTTGVSEEESDQVNAIPFIERKGI